jgi:hypothetical protein
MMAFYEAMTGILQAHHTLRIIIVRPTYRSVPSSFAGDMALLQVPRAKPKLKFRALMS